MRILIDKMVVGGLCALFTIFFPAGAAETPLRSPEVTHTGKGPTGYTVTFRYANPTAKKIGSSGFVVGKA